MENTAFKTNQTPERKLVSVPLSNKSARIKNLVSRIRHTLVGFVQPRFEADEWRRLEYKNEFSHERRKEHPPQWRF